MPQASSRLELVMSMTGSHRREACFPWQKMLYADCFLKQEGNLADSRKRRAAVTADQGGTQEEEEEEDSSEDDSASESDGDSPKEMKLTQITAGDVSDDEAREMLHRYQQQKLLEASQVGCPTWQRHLDTLGGECKDGRELLYRCGLGYSNCLPFRTIFVGWHGHAQYFPEEFRALALCHLDPFEGEGKSLRIWNRRKSRWS